MAIRLVHLVDEHMGDDAAQLCSLLMRKLPAGEISQQVATLGSMPASLVRPEQVSMSRVSRSSGWPALSALSVHRALKARRADVVLAWSTAACAAAGWGEHAAVVGVVCDPARARELSRWHRAVQWIGGGFQLVCTSGTVQRRLVESGVPMETTVVIRPGVDFAELRQARESASRERLGLPTNGHVLLTLSSPSRAGGQYYAVWASAILHHIWADATLIVPGVSREQQRIRRLVDGIYCPQVYRLTGNAYTPAELLAVADALIVPALADVPTDGLAWALAAGVPVIGSAVPCVTELIADRQNGFLCRPGAPHTLAICIRTAFESPDTMAACGQRARQQAFETFRAERCVDEFLRVIRNIASGETVLAGILDAAVDA